MCSQQALVAVQTLQMSRLRASSTSYEVVISASQQQHALALLRIPVVSTPKHPSRPRTKALGVPPIASRIFRLSGCNIWLRSATAVAVAVRPAQHVCTWHLHATLPAVKCVLACLHADIQPVFGSIQARLKITASPLPPRPVDLLKFPIVLLAAMLFSI
jgi:hypothetical protein